MSNEQKMHIGEIVREMRKQSNWTQEVLAEIVGVDVRTIQRLEKSGVAENETLIGVANAFKVTVETLKFFTDPVKQSEFQKLLKKIRILNEITDGKQAFDLIGGADGFIKDHPMPNSKEEADLFAGILQDFEDWGWIWDEATQQSKMEAMMQVSDMIKELKLKGFFLFGERRKMKLVSHGNKTSIPAQITSIIIVKADNKAIAVDELGNRRFSCIFEN